MTDTKIDYRYNAQERVKVALRDPKTDNALVTAQIATAEAVLALVEQTRLANLIALADHAHARWGNYAGEAGGMGTLFSHGETPESNMRIRNDIREGLGLS